MTNDENGREDERRSVVLAGGRRGARHRTDTRAKGSDGADALSRATMQISGGLFAGAVVAWVLVSGLLARKWPWELYGDGASQSDVLKLALGVVAAGGAAIALVVNYRRQQHLERDDAGRRDQVRLFTERFGAAAAQLGGASAAVRLAGVYAMAGLANEWDTQRQQCIDVLCGYLRLPYAGEPPAGHPELVVEQRQYAGGTIQRTETTAYQSGEIQVRRAIVDTVCQHLQPDAEPSWSNLNFDFSGAVLIDASFEGAAFSGRRTLFDGAVFSGGSTSFTKSTFSGQSTSFAGAAFSSTQTSFAKAEFLSEDTSFAKATFSGLVTAFTKATFSGEETWFDQATFLSEATSFAGATFSSEHTNFHRATFSGDHTWFDGVTFSSQHTSFAKATFSSQSTLFDGSTFLQPKHVVRPLDALFTREPWFSQATFSGQLASFHEAIFADVDSALGSARISAQDVRWGPVPPRSPWPPDPSENR